MAQESRCRMKRSLLEVVFNIHGRVVPVPGGVLLGFIGLGVGGWRLRRRGLA
jgi:hypothetical protein